MFLGKENMIKLRGQIKAVLKLNFISFAALMSLFVLSVVTGSVQAFSLDRPQVQSFIGQPLSVFVPVNGEQNERIDSNSLIVARPSARQLQGLGLNPDDYASFQYQVVQIGGKVGVLITSTDPLKEPYANLIVQVTYKGQNRIKQYPVLLDLPPSIPIKIPTVENGLVQLPTANPSVDSNTSELDNNQPDNLASSNIITYSPELMGAYDWAQQGAIPKKFGPVINGQSLWRVARRINKAMGVSIDQMAWGLYRANPSAFSSDSVESLQAGSTLIIPEESFVRQVTELQAVRLLAENQSPSPVAAPSNETATSVADAAVTTPENSSPAQDEPVADNALSSTEETNPEFTLSGVEPSDANQEVIATLNTTVAELSEQLLVKDQRITFLEKQIQQLTGIKPEELAGNEAEVASDIAVEGDQAALTDNAVVAVDEEQKNTADAGFDEIANEGVDERFDETSSDESNVVSEESGAEPELIVEPELVVEQPEVVAEPDLTVVSDTPEFVEENQPLADVVQPDSSFTSIDDESTINTPFWDWKKYLMLGLLALIVIAIFCRKLISRLISGLFSDEEEIVLNVPSVIDEQSRATAMENPFPDVLPKEKEPATEPLISFDVTSDDEEEEAEDFLLDDFDEDDDFFLEAEESVDVEEVNLSDRIKHLLNSGNFVEAKKTIDFAQETDMDEKYLDFCRLKISAAEENKPEFAKAFNRVNRRINDFHPEIQFKIAELHREMFDSEAVIDFGFIEEES